MATDTEMLDFLEAMGEPSGLKWIARPSVTGRGWRLHQDPRGEHATARAALEDAMTRRDETQTAQGLRAMCQFIDGVLRQEE